MERKGTGKLRVINDQKVFDCLINKKIGVFYEFYYNVYKKIF